MHSRQSIRCATLCLLALLTALPVLAQTQPRTLIPGSLADLPVNARDLGPAPASTPIRRMQLVLARTPQQEQALSSLLDRQQNKTSADYHHWLTPAAFGAAFGPSDHDLAALTAWLNAQGFDSIHVNAGRTLVEFSGSVSSVQTAFHTSIHALLLDGKSAYAATVGPSLPAEFSPIVAGFASLNNLPRQTPIVASPILRRDNETGVLTAVSDPKHPEYTLNSNNQVYYGITPYDFATLYDILPLWSAATPIDGTGESIAVVGESNINPADFVSFRTLFSLPLGNTNTPTGTQYLNIIYNGKDPGIQPSEFHADSDTQWASAGAKGAVIDYVVSQPTEASSGLDLSAAYIVDNNLAPILVDSYFTCEAQLGAGGNAFYKNLWEQAAAQGITVVTAAGDTGNAGCDDYHVAPASDGKAVNGLASTPYSITVGGTEFYTPNGVAQYFNPTNTADQASIKGYTPEIPWNDSCTNPAIYGQAPYTGFTAEQVCNNPAAQAALLVTADGAGGGASSAALNGAGYPKPSWQSAPGVPADGVRDIPDVAIFASQGRTNSYYVVCQQDLDVDGHACNLNFPYSDFLAYGGTEVATPAFAGILALAAEKAGGRIGNPNYVLYPLASRQSAAGTACNSTGITASGCIFHDITLGTNAMPCAAGSSGCVVAHAGDAVGILASPGATTGYDLASGLGSVDAANLVNAWNSVSYTPVAAILNVSPSSVVHGAAVTANVTVSAASGTPTGDISLNAQAANGSVGFGSLGGSLGGGSFSQSFRNFPGGSYGVQAHYAGDGTYAATDSNFVSLTVTPEPSITTIQTLSLNPVSNVATNVSTASYGNIWYIRYDVAGLSGQGSATGNVNVFDNGGTFANGVYRLNSSGYTEVQETAITPGTHVFTATYPGDPSLNPSSGGPVTLTITQAATTTSLTSSISTVSIGGVITLSAVVQTTGYGYLPPSGTITFKSGSTILGNSTVIPGADPATFIDRSTATLTLSAQNLPLGSLPVVAVYSGDANYLASTSSAAPLQVTGSTLTPTTTFVFPTPYSVAYGGSILYTALISPQTPSPGGTVQFIVDGENVGVPQAIAPRNYAAALQTTTGTLAPGFHILTAAYSGDGTRYRSSNSPTSQFLVTSAGTPSTVSFTANPTSLVQGTFISVAATVAPSAATGTVQLMLDGAFYGSPLPLTAGSVTLPLVTGTLQAGTHVLNVFYSGDTTYASSLATPTTLTIRAPGVTPSAVNVTGLSAYVTPGTSATFDAVVSPSSPTPTGILQIILDGGNPGLPILLTGTSTALSIPAASLPAGAHTVRLFYSGDNTYNFSTSPVSNFIVGSPSYTGDFTVTPASRTVTVSRLSFANATVYTVTPLSGFNAPVTFSCSNLPANTTCTFTPATIPGTSFQPGSIPATSTLVFNLDTGVTHHASMERHPFFSTASRIELAGILCLGLPLTLLKKRRGGRLPRLFALLLLAALASAVTGCGSGYAKGLTPMGTFDVTITATAPNAAHTAAVKLVVTE